MISKIPDNTAIELPDSLEPSGRAARQIMDNMCEQYAKLKDAYLNIQKNNKQLNSELADAREEIAKLNKKTN